MTTPKKPLFQKDASVPGGYLISMPGALLLAASAAYGPDDECTPEGRARGLRTVQRQRPDLARPNCLKPCCAMVK